MSVIATGSSNGLYVKSTTNIIGFGATVSASGAFVSSDGATIRYVTADPNGVVADKAGSLALRSNGSLYMNTNGVTAWALIGAVTVPGNAVIPDVANGGALANNLSGNLALTYGAGAETRTIANPVVVGQVLNISVASAGAGSCAITFASDIGTVGQNVATFNAADDYLQVTAVNRGGTVVWQLVSNQGVVLS